MQRTAQPMPTAAPGAKILVVAARYYEAITDELIRGALAVIEAGGAVAEVVEIPGAFEAPAAIALADRAGGYDGFVALGCVVRGETSHYDYVCGESARGLMDLAVNRNLAIGYGILTVESIEQAQARAAIAGRDKGGEAARAAIAMIALKRRWFGPRP